MEGFGLEETARRILAAEHRRSERTTEADLIEKGDVTALGQIAINAVVVALTLAPDGWVLAPNEPTPEMIDAGIMFGMSPNKVSIIYQSMINSRPPIEDNRDG